MKKILISIMAVATMLNLCSCSNELNDNPDPEKAIVFDNEQTRALVESADQILSMGVFAQKNRGDKDKNENGSNNYTMILDNEHVSRTNSSAPWTYKNTRYWERDREYHFFAVWPYSGENTSVTNVTEVEPVAGDGPYSYSVTFETPEKADQELLTAKKEVNTREQIPESVGFDFQHDLTNINLKIWSNGAPENVQDKIRVKEVTLSNVTKTGTLNTTTIDGSSWNYSSAKMAFTKTYEGEGITVSQAQIIDGQLVPNEVSVNNPDKDKPGIPFGDNGLLLIPHTITNSSPVVVTVIYDLQRPIDVEGNVWEKKKLQAFLPDGIWPAGKRLTYNLIISGERTITEFLINTVVEDWKEYPDEIDFTEQIQIGDEENKIHWVEGTYESWNREKGEVVLYSDVNIEATCYFNIQAPVGATWTASLIPLTASAMDAFSIVEETKHGVVGSADMQPIKIKLNKTDPISARNACKLRITVQTADGRSIVVKDLMPEGTDDGIEEFTIIQNLING